MKQNFKAKSELAGILIFAGTIALFIFSVYSMGYQVPTYLWIAIAVIIPLAFWVMAVTTYSVDKEHLFIQSGPFLNKLPLKAINSIERKELRRAGGRRKLNQLRIVYNEKRRMTLLPEDADGMIIALKKGNPRIEIKKNVAVKKKEDNSRNELD